MPRSEVKLSATVLILYLAISLTVYHPWSRTALIGGANGDVWPNLWGYRWFKGELLHGRFPTFSEQIGYPPGGKLYFLDVEGAVISIPFQLFLPLHWAYNATVIVETTLNCFCAYLLARTLTSGLAGFWAGLAYGLCPYLLSSASNGVTESLAAFWLPLLVLQLAKRTLRAALAAGLFGTLAAVGSWYYGVAAAGIIALWWLYDLRHGLGAATGRFVVSTAVFAALVLPFALLLRSTLGEGGMITPHQVSFEPVDEPNWRYRSKELDLANLVLPGGKAVPPLPFANTVNHVTYVGVVLLAMALLGSISSRRDVPSHESRVESAHEPSREAKFGPGFLWLLAIVFVVLAAGFHVHVAGRVFEHVPLPGLLLAKILAPYAAMEFPYRLVVVSVLALSVLGALGLERVISRKDVGERPHAKHRRIAIVVLCSLLLLGEYFVLSPATVALSDASVPAFHRQLASEPDCYAVLDLPAVDRNEIKERFIYFAAASGKRTPYEMEDIACDAIRQNDFFRACELLSVGGVQTIPERQVRDAIRQLRSERFRFVVLHHQLAEPGVARRLAEFLTRYLGEPTDHGEVTVWRIATREAAGR